MESCGSGRGFQKEIENEIPIISIMTFQGIHPQKKKKTLGIKVKPEDEESFQENPPPLPRTKRRGGGGRAEETKIELTVFPIAADIRVFSGKTGRKKKKKSNGGIHHVVVHTHTTHPRRILKNREEKGRKERRREMRKKNKKQKKNHPRFPRKSQSPLTFSKFRSPPLVGKKNKKGLIKIK